MFRDTSTVESMRPYVSRALADEDIRRNVSRAFRAARKVYDELSGEDAIDVARKLNRNRHDVRDELDTTVENLSEALIRLSGRKPGGHKGSWMMFLLLVAGGFLLFNPATGPTTRKWVKDHLFGSEEEFDYVAPDRS